ncbi:hypothetical protein RB595_000145 [Gaeumannomyces hyphopodioides]
MTTGGRRSLPHVPNEIWTLIAEQLACPLQTGDFDSVADAGNHFFWAPKAAHDLYNLCLTSRRMYGVAHSILYRDITLTSPTTAMRLCDTLMGKRPQLTRQVRSLALGFSFSPEGRCASRMATVINRRLRRLETLSVLPLHIGFTNVKETLDYSSFLRRLNKYVERTSRSALPARTLRLRPGVGRRLTNGFYLDKDRIPLRLILDAARMQGVGTLEVHRDEGPYHIPHPSWYRGISRLDWTNLDDNTARKWINLANRELPAAGVNSAVRELRLVESSMSSFDLRAMWRLLPGLRSFTFLRQRENDSESMTQMFGNPTCSADDMDSAFARYPHVAGGLPRSVEDLHIDLRVGTMELARLRGTLKSPTFGHQTADELERLIWQAGYDADWFEDPDIKNKVSYGPSDGSEPEAAEPSKAWPSRGPLASRRRTLNGLVTLHGVKRLTVRLELLHEAGTELKDTPLAQLLPPTVEELRLVEPIAAVYLKLLSLDSSITNEAGRTPIPRLESYSESPHGPPPPLASETATHSCLLALPPVCHARELGPAEVALAERLERHERWNSGTHSSGDVFARDGPCVSDDWALSSRDGWEPGQVLRPPLEGYLPDLHGCLARLAVGDEAAPPGLRRVVLVLAQEEHIDPGVDDAGGDAIVLRPEVRAMLEDLRARFADQGVAFEAVLYSEFEGREGERW